MSSPPLPLLGRIAVHLKLISPLRPGLIQSGDEGAGFRYLVMPIRLNV